MKRTITIVLLLATIIGISAIFSGCQSNNSFYVGQWTYPSKNQTLNLMENGTLTLDAKIYVDITMKTVSISHATGTWKVDGDKLKLQIIVDGRVFDTTAKIKESKDGKYLSFIRL